MADECKKTANKRFVTISVSPELAWRHTRHAFKEADEILWILEAEGNTNWRDALLWIQK